MNNATTANANAPCIMVVEDEPDIASVLADYLRASGFVPVLHSDGGRAFEALARSLPSLVLLDVMLPGMNGVDLLRELRRTSAVPVIMLTARVEEIDRLQSLELGADDYICKPFSPREVIARVRAVLRRTGAKGPSNASRLVLDPDASLAVLDGRNLELTRKELQLLATLAARPGRIFSRAQLLERVYPDDLDANERALDSHVKNLRRKLEAAGMPGESIRSVYGVGFAFDEP